MPPLSAEPLVGLKRPSRQKSLLPNQPFSRTPRGFEAGSGNSTRTTSPLSAEPLVGLKQRSCQPRDIGESLSAEPLVGLKLIDRIAD